MGDYMISFSIIYICYIFLLYMFFTSLHIQIYTYTFFFGVLKFYEWRIMNVDKGQEDLEFGDQS